MDKVKEIIHIINTARPMQWVMFCFVLWITLDFHEFYKQNFFKFVEWQNAGVLAYAALIIGLMKIIVDGVIKKKERDD